MLKGIVFDLDDTLYLEKDYVKSGFKAVASYICDKTIFNYDDIFSMLWSGFVNGIRGNNFNMLFEYYPHLNEYVTVEELVSVYRLHNPDIELLPDVAPILNNLRHMGFKLAVISDGFYSSQKKKAMALGLNNFFDLVILTDKYGREYWKPHPYAFELCQEEFELLGDQLCYIADNLDKDFIAPNKLGWLTIRLRMCEQLRYSDEVKPENISCPLVSFNSFSDLYSFIIKEKYRGY